MRLLVVMAAMTLGAVEGTLAQSKPLINVMVCLEGGIPGELLDTARLAGSRMFRRVGVRLVWRKLASPSCVQNKSEYVAVTFSRRTPPDRFPAAFAYALPYGPNQIEVFYDRVLLAAEPTQAAILAHVLVHEITHILEGTNMHSGGVMSAQWTERDLNQMVVQPLPFDPADVILIERGLKAWNERQNH
jgi:hypothetical protein